MNDKNEKLLIKTYPKLYKNLKYFECGDGWFHLINDLSEKLEKLIQEKSSGNDGEALLCAEQVKEKFGTLRFYMEWSSKEMKELIEEAELKSKETCEVCGKPGTLNKGTWCEVRCEKCK